MGVLKKIFNCIYLLLSTGSSLLGGLFSRCGERGATLSLGSSWASSLRVASLVGEQILERFGLHIYALELSSELPGLEHRQAQ